ncbi:MAG: YicC family protein [Clostridia bacterium]|nr:YicC family protein [Clostridia bacterium]
MNSMTGYGKGVAEGAQRRITVEIKSVNHRYLDLLFKLPRGFSFLEDSLRKLIQKTVQRGHLDIYCTYEDNREGKSTVRLDSILANEYREMAAELASMGFLNDMTASQVMKMPEVLLTKGAEDDEEEIKELAERAMSDALKMLSDMREREGKALVKDILSKLDGMETLTAEVKSRAPLVADDFKTRLTAKITDALSGVQLDEARLLNEVAFFVDRASIDEEITRLTSHIAQGRKIIAENNSAGRKLDFLVQEMNREVNTIGSKSNDLTITQKVLELKGEIEKVREQVQNIE